MTIADSGKANLAVTPVSLQRLAFENQQRVTVTVRRRQPQANAAQASVSLEIGGRAIQTQRVSVGGQRFGVRDVRSGDGRGERTSAGRSGWPTMRSRATTSFTSSCRLKIPCRVIVAERTGAPRDTSLYLARALAVGEAPRIDAKIRQADSISQEDLSTASVVILNDVPRRTEHGRTSAAIRRARRRTLRRARRARGLAASADILPGLPGPKVDRSRGAAARLGALEYGHPLFEVFRGPRTGDFAAARFYGYRSVTPAASVQMLARFDDGSPALLERKVGNGRVLMWTSTLDIFWNDLAIKPVFCPSCIASSGTWRPIRSRSRGASVGDVVDPALQTGSRGGERPQWR